MNTWLAVWDGDPALVARAGTALRSMTGVHPDLDPSTWTEVGGPGRTWAGAMTTCPRPGRTGAEVAAVDGQLVVVDGLAVTSGGAVLRADAVLHDDALDVRGLEGQFAVLRCSPDALYLDNDAFGLRHVYAWHRGTTWVLGSSVEAIARTVGGELDVDAVALYVTLGWAAGDTTLWSDVEQVPAGRSWRFDRTGIVLGAHFHRTELAGTRTRRYDPYPLASELEAQLRPLAALGAEGLYVAMSGGMDSRLIAALVSHADLPAAYYSVGHPESFDAQTAPVLAHAVGAEHHMYPQTLEDVVAGWESTVGSYVAQTDGLASVWVMGDLIGTEAIASRDAVIVQGVAGELARWYGWPLKALLRPTRPRVLAHLTRRIDHVGLASAGAREAAVHYVGQAMANASDDGFSDRDLLMVWYLSERARRWGGANNRKISNLNDVFTPFTTRPFMRESFRLHWARGYGEPIHHDLVARLSPPLFAEPPEMGAWPVQVPFLNIAVDRYRRRRPEPAAVRPSRTVALYHQDRWPGRLRRQLAERYLDDHTSAAWEVVDRSRFERLLTEEDDTHRREAASTILLLTTVLEYDNFRRSAPQL